MKNDEILDESITKYKALNEKRIFKKELVGEYGDIIQKLVL